MPTGERCKANEAQYRQGNGSNAGMSNQYTIALENPLFFNSRQAWKYDLGPEVLRHAK
jgi:hypothetical protein